MDVVKLIALCVAAALMCASLRVQRPEMAMALSLTAGVLAILWALTPIRQVVEGMSALARGAGLSESSGSLVLRAAGVALLTEFAAQLCRDAGEGALAGRVELGGRAALLAMSLPLLTGLAQSLGALLP